MTHPHWNGQNVSVAGQAEISANYKYWVGFPARVNLKEFATRWLSQTGVCIIVLLCLSQAEVCITALTCLWRMCRGEMRRYNPITVKPRHNACHYQSYILLFQFDFVDMKQRKSGFNSIDATKRCVQIQISLYLCFIHNLQTINRGETAKFSKFCMVLLQVSA